IAYVIVRLDNGARLLPDQDRAQVLDVRKALWQLVVDRLQRMTRIYHVVDEQLVIAEARRSHRHVLGDDELAARRASVHRIRMRGKNRQRRLVDAGEDVADAQAAARDTDELIAAPTRLVHPER